MRRLLLTGPIVLSLLIPAFGAAVPPVAPANPTIPPAGSTPSLTVTGKITTGITLNDGKLTYELDIKNAALKKTAEDLNGKQVTVKGTLTIKAGVEVGQRRIITVETLEPAATTTNPATQP